MNKIKKTIALSLGLMVGAQSLAISEGCAWWRSLWSGVGGGIIAAFAATRYYDERTGGKATETALACGAVGGILGGIATTYISSGILHKYTPRPALTRWEDAYRSLHYQYAELLQNKKESGFDFKWAEDRDRFHANINLKYIPGWFEGFRNQGAKAERKNQFFRQEIDRKIKEAQIVYDKLNKLKAWLDAIIIDLKASRSTSAEKFDPNTIALEKAEQYKKEIGNIKNILESNRKYNDASVTRNV